MMGRLPRSRRSRPGVSDTAAYFGVEVLTEQEAANVLKCSVAALRRMRRESRGPRWTKLGKLIRYRPDWLRDFLEENAVKQQEVEHED
jgi:hypothetical protein